MPRLSRWASLAATAGAVAASLTNNDRLMRATKPWIVPALQAGIVAGPSSRRTAALLASTAAATAGDCLLMKEHRLAGAEARRAFRAGVASFAVQQIGYSTVLWRRGARPRPVLAAGAAALLAAVGVQAKRGEPETWPMLVGYGGLVAATGVLATDSGRPGLAVGGPLFVLSDALIVVRRMLVRDPVLDRWVDAAVLATYGAAQVLLVEGLAAAEGSG